MNLKFIIILIFFGANLLQGQTLPVSEREVLAELEKRGIAEEDLIREMNARGIAVEDLENLSPSQIVELEQIVKELEDRNSENEGEAEQGGEVVKEVFLDAPTIQEKEEVKEEIAEVIAEEMDIQEPIAPIYGHAFFKNRDLSLFETSTEVKAPDSYILGAGDKIVISIYGISRQELGLEIDQEGYIEVNKRRIFLKGLSLGSAKKKLFETLSRFYRFQTGEFDVSLSYSRTINVNIQGEVTSPGGYTISAINNAYNGLIAAGGPTEIGSLRDILLIRSNGEVVNLDFYSYLQNPKNLTNAALEEGDVIVIPVARKIVNLKGGVRRPMMYELKNSEKLSDLIDLGGGFVSKANRESIQILRNGLGGLTYLDVKGVEASQTSLNDGDQIQVRVVENELNNFVEITGAVVNAGVYERTDQLTLGALIELAGISPDGRRDFVFIRRTEDDGRIVYIKVDASLESADLETKLQNKDRVSIYSQSIYNDNQQFEISGAVRSPGAFRISLDQTMSIKDAIEIAGGLRRDASGIAIMHTSDPLNPKVKQYMRINLVDAFDDDEFYRISALDSLEIFSESLFDEASSVMVRGAVNNPGAYQYGLGMSIADVLTMSGGFKLGAATNRIEVSRVVIENNEPTKTVIANLNIDRELNEGSENLDFVLQPYDEIMVRFVPEFELQQIITLEGEVKFPGAYSLIKDNETVRDVILRAGGITAQAFPYAAKLIRADDNLGVVIVKLDDVLSSSSSRYNFKLKNGDRIVIPRSKDFVSIVGATNASKYYERNIIGEQNQLNVPFHKGKDAKFYIETYAGGISELGSSKEVYVENANGQISRTKNYFFYKNYPEVITGSKIVVGYKPVKTKEQKEREDVDWSKVLADSVGQAVSILSLLLLIQRI